MKEEHELEDAPDSPLLRVKASQNDKKERLGVVDPTLPIDDSLT